MRKVGYRSLALVFLIGQSSDQGRCPGPETLSSHNGV